MGCPGKWEAADRTKEVGRRFQSLGVKRQRGAAAGSGEKEVAGRGGVGERKSILWLVAKWRDNRRVRGLRAGDRLGWD